MRAQALTPESVHRLMQRLRGNMIEYSASRSVSRLVKQWVRRWASRFSPSCRPPKVTRILSFHQKKKAKKTQTNGDFDVLSVGLDFPGYVRRGGGGGSVRRAHSFRRSPRRSTGLSLGSRWFFRFGGQQFQDSFAQGRCNPLQMNTSIHSTSVATSEGGK